MGSDKQELNGYRPVPDIIPDPPMSREKALAILAEQERIKALIRDGVKSGELDPEKFVIVKPGFLDHDGGQ